MVITAKKVDSDEEEAAADSVLVRMTTTMKMEK